MTKLFEIEVNRNESNGSFLNIQYQPIYDKCCLSLSSNKSYSNYLRLKSILNWLDQNFEEILIIEGSYLNRWNLYALNNFSEYEIMRSIKSETIKVQRRINKVIDELKLNNKIQVLNWEGTISSPTYLNISSKLKKFYDSNNKFQNNVMETIENYYLKLNKRKPNENQMQFFIKYVLEEIAILLFVYDKNFKIEVYPGPDQPILINIAKGIFNNFPFDFSLRTHLSINLKEQIL